jgi:hypothetical protein
VAKNPETEIMRQCLITINMFELQNGVKAYRINSAGVYNEAIGQYMKSSQFAAKGIADILIIAQPDRGNPQGKVIFLEVKTPKGRLSDSQVQFKAQCDKFCIPYEVARSPEDARVVLRKYNIIGGELDRLPVDGDPI